MMHAADDSGGAPAVVRASLAEYSSRLVGLAPAVTADEPDAVHQARVLVRRLRSTLAAYRSLFDRAQVDRARSALAELGDELGAVRDLEVRLAMAEEYLAVESAASMRSRLVDDVRARHRAAHTRLVAALAPDDWTRSTAGLLAARPASRGRSDDGTSAEIALAGALAGEVRRVRRAGARAGTDLASLHRLRRAARRLRYAVDAVTEGPRAAFGENVRAVSTAAEAVQDLLGADRDRRLFAAELEAIIDEAGDDGPSVGGYRRLAERVRRDAAERVHELPAAMRELDARARPLD